MFIYANKNAIANHCLNSEHYNYFDLFLVQCLTDVILCDAARVSTIRVCMRETFGRIIGLGSSVG